MQRLIRGRGESLPTRAFFVAIAAALMIITGLVGMHTLSAGMADPSMSAVSHDTAAPLHATQTMHAVSTADDTVQACHGACSTTDAPPSQHDAVMMACVLALLVGFAFLIPAFLTYRTLVFPKKLQLVSTHLRNHSLLPRPPSLIVLSISRT